MHSISEITSSIVNDFEQLEFANEKFELLVELGQQLEAMDASLKTDQNLVKGCQSSVWFHITCIDGRLSIVADSDSFIVKGLAALLVKAFSGQLAQDILDADSSFIEKIGFWRQLSLQRGNGLTAMMDHIQRTAKNCNQSNSKLRVLFLCTGNSCRSQMAEALINARFGDRWQAVSAGTRPAGFVHPKAIAVLHEIGIDHSGVSKHADVFKGESFDLVITVCDSANEECPLWLGKGKRAHHSFPDPALTDNIEDFRKVRDAISIEIPALMQQLTDNS